MPFSVEVMAFRQVLQLLILGALGLHVTAQFDCDPINVAISSDHTTYDGTFMTYIGQSTNIECRVSCDNCEQQSLYWRQDGDPVYIKDWLGDTSGPQDGYENKVEHDLIEGDIDGVYTLQWKSADWDDLTTGNHTTWDCQFYTDICVFKMDVMELNYYRRPYLSMYADNKEVTDFDDLPTDKGTANCTVLSYPASQVILEQDDIIIKNSSSCSLHGNEFICSVSFPDFDFKKGFSCRVIYRSPETNADEEVIPDGCCSEGLYPASNGGGLSPGGIAGIVIGCVVFVVCVGAAVYFVKFRPSTSGSTA